MSIGFIGGIGRDNSSTIGIPPMGDFFGGLLGLRSVLVFELLSGGNFGNGCTFLALAGRAGQEVPLLS